MANADVWLVSHDRRARTDSVGRFALDGLRPGTGLLEIRRLGFLALRDTVMLVPRASIDRRYVLASQATQLDTVHTIAGQRKYVSPMLQGFEVRRASHASGHFISDSVLRRSENSTLADVVTSHMPGIMVGRSWAFVSTRKACRGLVILGSGRKGNCQTTGVSDCYVSIYLDGALLFSPQMADAGATPPDAHHMSVTDLAGIEFYPSAATAPAGMHVSDQGCGALWLWTREK